MRIGSNPHKDKPNTASEYVHQVIIPVYIPNQEGYFKDSFRILQLCLESLLATVNTQTFISIVNNGSCDLVVNYLNKLFTDKKIQELIHNQNIGKMNAVLKGISGHDFSLITISDADVLFLSDWQEATYTVFENFPKAGAVCPTPSPRSLRTFTATIYWDLFFSKKLKFSSVCNKEALGNFAKSVGDSNFYNKVQLQKIFTVCTKDAKAVVGAGHFAATYRAEVFGELVPKFADFKLGGTSEKNILDKPVVQKGLWRLSTYDNYAYHLGNVAEDWMFVKLAELTVKKDPRALHLAPFKKEKKGYNWIKNKLFAKIILNKKIFKWFILWKGLSKTEAKNYLKQ